MTMPTLTRTEKQLLVRAAFQGLKGSQQITFNASEEKAAESLTVKLGQMAVDLAGVGK